MDILDNNIIGPVNFDVNLNDERYEVENQRNVDGNLAFNEHFLSFEHIIAPYCVSPLIIRK